MNPFGTSKIFAHPDRLAEWQATGDTWPVTAELDMTNHCTDSCPCCAGGRKKPQVELQTRRVESLISELKASGVRGLIFTGGGEPLCHKDTPRMMTRAYETGLDTALITNGVLVDADRQWPAFSDATWIRFSLDAANKDMYRVAHGTRHFERVCKNIHALAAVRGACKTPTLGVGYLVSEQTVGEMVDAAKLCASFGVDYLQYRPYHHATRNKDLPQRALENYRAAQQYSHNGFSVLWSEHKFRTMLANPGEPSRPYGKCYGHAFAATIAADGNVYLCCHLRGIDKYVLGNVYDHAFADIWRGETRGQVAGGIDFKDCVPVCRCDSFNATLWDMKHSPPAHGNFL